jgi:hypothetical protein
LGVIVDDDQVAEMGLEFGFDGERIGESSSIGPAFVIDDEDGEPGKGVESGGGRCCQWFNGHADSLEVYKRKN